MTGSFLEEPAVSPPVQALYEEDLAESGYVWNVSRLWAHQPGTLERLFELMSQAPRRALRVSRALRRDVLCAPPHALPAQLRACERPLRRGGARVALVGGPGAPEPFRPTTTSYKCSTTTWRCCTCRRSATTQTCGASRTQRGATRCSANSASIK